MHYFVLYVHALYIFHRIKNDPFGLFFLVFCHWNIQFSQRAHKYDNSYSVANPASPLTNTILLNIEICPKTLRYICLILSKFSKLRGASLPGSQSGLCPGPNALFCFVNNDTKLWSRLILRLVPTLKNDATCLYIILKE